LTLNKTKQNKTKQNKTKQNKTKYIYINIYIGGDPRHRILAATSSSLKRKNERTTNIKLAQIRGYNNVSTSSSQSAFTKNITLSMNTDRIIEKITYM
jgi:hypothetical protein